MLGLAYCVPAILGIALAWNPTASSYNDRALNGASATQKRALTTSQAQSPGSNNFATASNVNVSTSISNVTDLLIQPTTCEQHAPCPSRHIFGRLLYWPERDTLRNHQSAPSTAVYQGKTLTSPTVYLYHVGIATTVLISNSLCPPKTYPSITADVIPVSDGDLQQYMKPQKSYQQEVFTESTLVASVTVSTLADCAGVSRGKSFIHQTINNTPVSADKCFPLMVMPSKVIQQLPSHWKTCHDRAGLWRIYDPPVPLTPEPMIHSLDTASSPVTSVSTQPSPTSAQPKLIASPGTVISTSIPGSPTGAVRYDSNNSGSGSGSGGGGDSGDSDNESENGSEGGDVSGSNVAPEGSHFPTTITTSISQPSISPDIGTGEGTKAVSGARRPAAWALILMSVWMNL